MLIKVDNLLLYYPFSSKVKMNNLIIKFIPHGGAFYQQMVDLRHELLRKPLKLQFSPVELSKEKHDILIGAFEEKELLGCCILSKLEEHCVKLRQMAVSMNKQKNGVGTALLQFAENHARENGYQLLFMHARETAIQFYEKAGYQICGDCFKEVGIRHYRMEKVLSGKS